MPESENLLAPAATQDPWVQEGALWPWISRFFWSPAADMHPSRRPHLLPGWPGEAWSDAAVLAHVSRHLLSVHGLLADEASGASFNRNGGGFLIALLPQTPLARLARYVGLALHGAATLEGPALDEAESLFVAQRAPLYWRASAPPTREPEASGWSALKQAIGPQPEEVMRRFEWKTPAATGQAQSVAGPGVMFVLVQKIIKEFEEPWPSLFATLRRPGHQIRLHG